MIYHSIYKMVECGIKEILVVTGLEYMGDVVRLLGSGADFSVRLTYKVQDRPGGIAQALELASDFAGDDRILVILGDNVFEDSLRPYVETFQRQSQGAKLLLKQVENPERFGVAEIQGNRIIGIEEKPRRPKSSYCVTGIYLYDSQVFSFIRGLTPSARGELEITDVNNLYIKHSILTYDILRGWWSDTGTPRSLQKANQYAAEMELNFDFRVEGGEG